MPHVYASLADAKEYARDEGTAWAAGSTNDRRALAILESVSRRVDEWCGRSAFGSGFGPRTGTNRYDGSGDTDLFLRDDLISATTVTRRAATAAATTSTLTANTDYYLRNQRGQYEPGPYRTVILHGLGTATFGTGFRVTDLLGSWGHQDVRRTLVATTAEALDDNETGIDLSASALTEISPGMTLLLESEQVYVRSVTSGTPDVATVDRGQNGTTAATHVTSLAISKYVYDAAVVDATLRLWGRRWTARYAGADGADGGGAMGIVNPRESEDTILRRTVGHLRLQTLVAAS